MLLTFLFGLQNFGCQFLRQKYEYRNLKIFLRMDVYAKRNLNFQWQILFFFACEKV